MTEEVAPPAPKRTLKQRLQAHFAEYGRIAIYTYLTLSITTIIAFSIAIGLGVAPSSATGVFGVIGAGWIAAKATMPLRILATLGLTPIVATLWHRWRKAHPRPPTEDEEEDDDDESGDAPESDGGTETAPPPTPPPTARVVRRPGTGN